MGKPKMKWVRKVEFTEDQSSVIAECLCFINDIGLPDHIDEKVFDEAFDVVNDDSPFEWSCHQLDSLSEGKDQ